MMASHFPFEEFILQLQEDFRKNDFSSALARLQDGYPEFPEQRTILDYWRIMLLARQGEMDNVLSELEASLETGNWFSEVLLRRSPALQALQGDPRFERLLAHNQEIAEKDRARQFPYYILRPEGRCKAGMSPCPLLIGLHINGGSVSRSMDFWKPAAALGWLVAAPQSSQALMKGVCVWDDRSITEQELIHDSSSLSEHYSINAWQTVLAGHSTSSEIAIWLILNGKLDIKNFLVINPSGAGILDLSRWRSLLEENQPNEIRGYFLIGELDSTVQQEPVAELVEMFSLSGLITEMEIVNGVNGDYQPGYDEAIARSLNFLVG